MQVTRTQSQPSFKSARFRNPDQLVDFARNREFTKILDNARRGASMPARFQIQYTPSLENPLWVSCTKEGVCPTVNRLHRQEVPIYRLSGVIDDLYEAAEKDYHAPIVQIPDKSLDKTEIRGFWNAMRVAARGIIDVDAADALLTHLNKTSTRTVINQLEKIHKPEKANTRLFLGFNPKKEAPFSVGCIESNGLTAGVFKEDVSPEQIAQATQQALQEAQRQSSMPSRQHSLNLTQNAYLERKRKIFEIERID